MDLSPGDLDAAAHMIRQYGLLFAFELADLDDELRQSAADLPLEPPEEGGMGGGYHRREVAAHMESAQEAITTWVASQRPGGLEELVESDVTDGMLSDVQSQGLLEVRNHQDLRELLISLKLDALESAINSALHSFSIGIGGLETRQPTVYSVSFLQMYNHLVERATLRTCANETCRGLFVRQRGRARYQQFRTAGVMYCSRGCARAQAQRQLRRRRRALSSSARQAQTFEVAGPP